MPKLTPLITQTEIAHQVQRLGEEITAFYAGEPLVAICVLKGASLFFADLVRTIKSPVEIDFIQLSSYGAGTESTGQIIFKKDVDIDLQGKNILIVEDIIDSGITMNFLLQYFKDKGAKSVNAAAFVDKSERREIEVDCKFVGIKLSKGFIVGYGLDYAEQYRCLDNICTLQL